MKIFRRKLFLYIIAFLTIVIFFKYHSRMDMNPSSDQKPNAQPEQLEIPLQLRQPLQKKMILFGSKWWFTHYPYLEQVEARCPQCTFTEDLDLFNMSDAVVFHGPTLPLSPPNQKYRPKNQIWVWLFLETPWEERDFHLRTAAANYSHLFNWTMTYRKDSDIFIPYGRIFSYAEMSKPDYSQAWAFMPTESKKPMTIYTESLMKIPTEVELKGRKMVSWIASSNCHTAPSERFALAKELKKYVGVDVYGKCGKENHYCPQYKFDLKSGNIGIHCRFNISQNYKFHLAFENSVCEDYVTEKFFDTLFTPMIPIVYGGANYNKIAPKGSFINVADFKSVKALTDYLIYLDKHPKEYLKYFEWRKNFWVQNNGYVTGFCDLCKKLWKGSKNEQKSYGNLMEWWYRSSDYKRSGEMACKKPSSPEIFEKQGCFEFLRS